MKTVIALCVAGAAALSFTSCTCPACQGSGLQVRSSRGLVPYQTGSIAHQNVETVTCVRCGGSGDNMNQLMRGVDLVNKVADASHNVAGAIDHGHRR